MSKVIVRGGNPGKIRCEVEGTDSFIEVDSGLSVYQGLHELQPWLQALLDAQPPVEPVAPTRKSKAPPKGDE